MSRIIAVSKKILLVAVLAGLAGCSSFRSQVTGFYEKPLPAAGKTVSITGLNPEREDSLELKHYSQYIAPGLVAAGYKIEEGETDLVAKFDITWSEGVQSEPFVFGMDPFWNGFYQQYVLVRGRNGLLFYRPVPLYYNPFAYSRMYGRERSYYTVTLWFELRDNNDNLLYEARAETRSFRKDLPRLVPLLSEALFEGFPGESGVTRSIRIKKD